MGAERKYRPKKCTVCGGRCIAYKTLPLDGGDSLRYYHCRRCGTHFKAHIPKVILVITNIGQPPIEKQLDLF